MHSILLIALLAACPQDGESEAAPAPRFVSKPLTIASAEGARTIGTTSGAVEKNYILEVNGGGLVLGDFDADGRHDLVVVDGSTIERAKKGEPGLPPRLFLGDGAGGFSEPGGDWAMAGAIWGMGGAAGDVDGDGDLDLMITEWGPDRLFLNDGGAGFTETTEKSGLRGRAWGTSAAFTDVDRDGALDLVVINYLRSTLDDITSGEIASRESGACRWKGYPVMCGPEGLNPMHDKLYRGAGDGTFADVSVASGFRPLNAGFGLGVTTLDYDADGDTDLYVTNDSTPNHLWENAGDGTFSEVGARRQVAFDSGGKEQAGMGIAVGDVNADGFADLFVTNFSGESNSLYLSSPSKRAGGQLRYVERSAPMKLGGPSRRWLGWGTAFFDADNDADLDLFVLNGHVYPQADQAGTDSAYAQEDHLYVNEGGDSFSLEVLHDGGPTVMRSGAAADFDGDGDLDIVGIEMDGPVRLFENRGAAGHWLRVQLRGQGGNTQALGATVEATAGETKQRAEIRTAGGFQAAVPAEAHFGFGATEVCGELRVTWPSGEVTVLEDVALDRVLVIEEPAEEAEAEGSR
ncbi:CRTAC1 family protein [Engelhardtia mirabilis]|uniref:FG-GAP repeat protein n=1 Tax=Engelhardtia mirabilis TaxID=2528011 RepID=A0A518BQI0_9BACT|nr:FG-GAP repeat protein [Planctomycetes bacterium Pla133]QDV03549.1 FG-GAP repeat protein [Planctomycetes bacterium Pla86]